VLAAPRFVYLVLAVTVTGVCVALPLPSVLVTLMVLPATEATVPWIPDRFAGAEVGGHLPSTVGLTRTDVAVAGWPPWDSSWLGRALTQLPVVTSVSDAGVTSVTVVDVVKSTVALPCFWVTWAALPDTDAISPLTCAWPLAGGGVAVPEGAAPELVLPADVAEDCGLDVFDEPHAAMDSAVTPVTAKIAKRVSRV
jgi:hypothetical protein